MCLDGGAPDLPPDGPSCKGSNPAAATCRKTPTDCIPSTCYCGGEGPWVCTADCRTSLPLCADAGVTDSAPDTGADRPADADSGAGAASSCSLCSGTEVCVQSFDGMCGGGSVTCKAVSEACRTKLSASGSKSCKSIPECESEFCATPSYRCVYDPPCGGEAKDAQVYCYGA